jgi:hypothetical protein
MAITKTPIPDPAAADALVGPAVQAAKAKQAARAKAGSPAAKIEMQVVKLVAALNKINPDVVAEAIDRYQSQEEQSEGEAPMAGVGQ